MPQKGSPKVAQLHLRPREYSSNPQTKAKDMRSGL